MEMEARCLVGKHSWFDHAGSVGAQKPHIFSGEHSLTESKAQDSGFILYRLLCALWGGRWSLPSLPDNETGCLGHWSGTRGHWIIFPILPLAFTVLSDGEGHYTESDWVFEKNMPIVPK